MKGGLDARPSFCYNIDMGLFNPTDRERTLTSLRALREGKVLDLDGLKLRKSAGAIGPGDLYVGGRNTGPKLLICQRVDHQLGCIFSEEGSYPYNIGECVRVEEV